MKLVLPLVAAAALLAGCGSSDTTTVVNNTTTTTVVEESSSSTTSTAEPATASSTTTPATSTEDSGSTQNLSSFQSPSGNIGCIMSADSVRCDIAEKQWTADRPADCPKQVDYGQGLELPANGYARVVCAGDTVLDPSAPTLAYGDSTRAGSIVCVSAEAGMDCANDSGGHFRIARESYDLG